MLPIRRGIVASLLAFAALLAPTTTGGSAEAAEKLSYRQEYCNYVFSLLGGAKPDPARIDRLLAASLEQHAGKPEEVARDAELLIGVVPEGIEVQVRSFRLLEDLQSKAPQSVSRLKLDLEAFRRWSDDPALTSRILSELAKRLEPAESRALMRDMEVLRREASAAEPSSDPPPSVPAGERLLSPEGTLEGTRQGIAESVAAGLPPLDEAIRLTARTVERHVRTHLETEKQKAQSKPVTTATPVRPVKPPRNQQSTADSENDEDEDNLRDELIREIEQRLGRSLSDQEKDEAWKLWKRGERIDRIVLRMKARTPAATRKAAP